MIPVRESKITHLFEDFFYDKEKASFIINVNRSIYEFDETIQVMGYLNRGEKFAALKSTLVAS